MKMTQANVLPQADTTDASSSGGIRLVSDDKGLAYIEIENQYATAKLALQGAHVMHWQPKSASEPVLWLSSNARFMPGRSIRGGVPVCWPWFGAHPTDSS
jgi:glucose-6-phosphate 1-epimerase